MDADFGKPLVVDSLIIQSPYLKRVLSKVLKDYPGIVVEVSRLKLEAPFECFVHRWDEFLAVKDDASLDETTKEHVELLYNILKEDLGDVIRLREDYFKNKVVSYDHLWTLFPPGCTVLGSKNEKPVALKFEQGDYAKLASGEVYMLSCVGVDWDGTKMGWADIVLTIPKFNGTTPFAELPAHPLEYHPQAELVTQNLVERGRKFESLAGYHYKAYSGNAVYYFGPERKTRRDLVQSRIVVDGKNWQRCNPEGHIRLRRLHESIMPKLNRRDSCASMGSVASNDSYDSSLNLARRSTRVDDEPETTPLTEDQLLMATPMVRGYALKNKKWMEFFVEDIGEIQFDSGAFDSLVLAQDHKELILAFAQSQVKFKDSFDDIISGKGKGIIMLLSGGPGIGKTLTAESVAEEMRAPLYIMSAGDLGGHPHEIENTLTQVLSMVANWNAVLLLDECDVFLEARNSRDMHRNRIVSIFLRMLEYYEGILFLTTNRVEQMDAAFRSRIHISLEYPPLDAAARAGVWRTFLARAAGPAGGGDEAAHDVTEEEVAALSGLVLNGREIKNVLKTGNLLARSKDEKLGFDHLQTVLRVQGHSL